MGGGGKRNTSAIWRGTYGHFFVLMMDEAGVADAAPPQVDAGYGKVLTRAQVYDSYMPASIR